MLKRKAEMTHESKKVWGGKGELDLCKILTPEELGGRAKLFNIVTVAPGQSIGLHSHTDDSEVYFLLEGELEVTDNDTKTTMHTGDAMFTADGGTHSAENCTDQEMCIRDSCKAVQLREFLQEP